MIMEINLLIAEVFRDAGLIERYGSGVSRAIAKFIDYGLEVPEIREFKGGFDLTLYGIKFNNNVSDKSVDKSKKTVEKTVEKILKLIENNPQITQTELSNLTKLSIRGIEWNLNKLKERGLIERVGPDKGGYWRVLRDKK